MVLDIALSLISVFPLGTNASVVLGRDRIDVADIYTSHGRRLLFVHGCGVCFFELVGYPDQGQTEFRSLRSGQWLDLIQFVPPLPWFDTPRSGFDAFHFRAGHVPGPNIDVMFPDWILLFF
jgi:hypothetical protein